MSLLGEKVEIVRRVKQHSVPVWPKAPGIDGEGDPALFSESLADSGVDRRRHQ